MVFVQVLTRGARQLLYQKTMQIPRGAGSALWVDFWGVFTSELFLLASSLTGYSRAFIKLACRFTVLSLDYRKQSADLQPSVVSSAG